MYPRLFHIYGPIWIQSYGVTIVIGFMVFLFLAYNDPRRAKLLDSDTFFNTIFVGLISAILGGRLLFIISEWNTLQDPLIEFFYIWQGGFVLLGSILGVAIAVPIYLKTHGIPAIKFLDIIAQYGPLLQSISRVGCLLAGCCYGAPALNSRCSIMFNSAAGLAPTGICLYPTQIYMSILSLSIFIILFALKRFLKEPGQIFFLYMILECISRIVIDFWRGDRGELTKLPYLPENFYLSLMQIWSAIFLVLSISIFIFISSKKRKI
jgi:phosphatidylglycerol---prolipoprotein diacylglyceryl transferase